MQQLVPLSPLGRQRVADVVIIGAKKCGTRAPADAEPPPVHRVGGRGSSLLRPVLLPRRGLVPAPDAGSRARSADPGEDARLLRDGLGARADGGCEPRHSGGAGGAGPGVAPDL